MTEVRARCPSCLGVLAETVWTSSTHRPAVACSKCRTIRYDASPDELKANPYGDAYFRTAYDSRDAELERSFSLHLREARLPDPPGSCLDVGCGSGIFLAAALRAGWDAVGMDPSRAGIERAVKRCGSGKVVLAHSHELPFRGRFDLITMWDVLAHVARPGETLQAIHKALSEEGALVIKTPNRPERVFRRVRRHCSWAKRFGDQALHLPRQLNHFTPQSLTKVLVTQGFEVLWTKWVDEVEVAPKHPTLKTRVASVLLDYMRGDGPPSFLLCAKPAKAAS